MNPFIKANQSHTITMFWWQRPCGRRTFKRETLMSNTINYKSINIFQLQKSSLTEMGQTQTPEENCTKLPLYADQRVNHSKIDHKEKEKWMDHGNNIKSPHPTSHKTNKQTTTTNLKLFLISKMWISDSPFSSTIQI